MKICAACTLELPEESFSNNQWQLKLHLRRCRACITNKHVAQLTTPECWICKEDEVEKSERLRRDCSCRGTDAGFVHLSCLVRYAKKKNIEWDRRDPDDRRILDFVRPWKVCPNCHQFYENTLEADIANEFVSFIEREHPNDQEKQVEALRHKLFALSNSHQPTQINEAKEVATRVLVLIREMEIDMPMLPTRLTNFQAYTYIELGRIACKEGSEASCREALVHLGKSLELYKAINFAAGAAYTEYCISLVKSKLENDTSRINEDQLKKSQDVYDMRVRDCGEESALTINPGVDLAIELWEANRGVEAERLLIRVADLSERVHGPQHNTTKRAKLWLKKINTRRAN